MSLTERLLLDKKLADHNSYWIESGVISVYASYKYNGSHCFLLDSGAVAQFTDNNVLSVELVNSDLLLKMKDGSTLTIR